MIVFVNSVIVGAFGLNVEIHEMNKTLSGAIYYEMSNCSHRSNWSYIPI